MKGFQFFKCFFYRENCFLNQLIVNKITFSLTPWHFFFDSRSRFHSLLGTFYWLSLIESSPNEVEKVSVALEGRISLTLLRPFSALPRNTSFSVLWEISFGSYLVISGYKIKWKLLLKMFYSCLILSEGIVEAVWKEIFLPKFYSNQITQNAKF